MKKIFVFVGNPDAETLSGHLADTYENAARSSGNEVRRMNIGDLSFDPILHKGYKVIQELEPDLLSFQENVRWADHFVLIYPIWWSGMPAILKGLIDRLWIPGFAFRFHKTGLGKGLLWDKLLKGKTARVITLSKTAPLVIRFMFGDFTNEILSAILAFAGFSTSLTQFGNSESVSDSYRQRFEKKVATLGRRGA